MMNRIKNKLLGKIAVLAVVFMSSAVAGPLYGNGKIEVGGAFLGLFNYLDQSNRPETEPQRKQFDFAGNIDFQWQPAKNITVLLQVQGGAGEGSLGFVGATPAITDLNVEVRFSSALTVTFGSFDTPIGVETPYLTNNADTSGNSMILNTLFYSAIAETNVGTLNTLGVKGDFSGSWGDITLALTNGTDEAAFNGDGYFEYVIFAKTKPFLKMFTLAGSYMNSNDRSVSGESGTGSRFSAWMADLEIAKDDLFFVRAYYGEAVYGDDNPATDDTVSIWKIEARYDFKSFYLAGRVSAWEPGGSGNLLIPNPGYGLDIGGAGIYQGHDIRRIQAGLAWKYKAGILVKAEWFFDDYRGNSPDMDTQGLLLTCNILL
jgi:hypothetical protein